MREVFFGVALALSVSAIPAFAQDSLPRNIKGGVLNRKATSLPKPEYPAEAKSAGIEGTVFVDVVVDESGTVISAKASMEPRKAFRTKNGDDTVTETEIAPADQSLREAAEKAALQARFSPTLFTGTPVKVEGTIIYNFVADGRTSFINGGLLNPRAESLPLPAYPPAAMAVRAEGSVAVRVTVDEDGNVIEATAISGHPLLRTAAVEAARQAKFNPAKVDGKLVKVSGIITYDFAGPARDNSN
jgi:TonB family protein